MIVEEPRRQRFTHMPDHVIGEHARKDVGAHPSGEAVVNRADVEVHGFYGTEGPLDLGDALIGEDDGGCIKRFGRDAGSQHIKAVEGPPPFGWKPRCA